MAVLKRPWAGWARICQIAPANGTTAARDQSDGVWGVTCTITPNTG